MSKIRISGGGITMKNIRMIEIYRVFSSGISERVTDEVIQEDSYILEIDGKEEIKVVLSEGHEKLWALGNLLCRGVISSIKDIDSIRILEGNRIKVSTSNSSHGDLIESEYNQEVSGEIDPVKSITITEPFSDCRITAASLLMAVESLSEAPLFVRTGGVHVAALCSSEGKVLFRTVDLGRHNVVDKVLGWSVSENIERHKCCLVISGRIPADMVRKAVVSGIPVIASISAVTASAVEIALAEGITLIGFARNGRMNVYTYPERVLVHQG